MEQPRKSSLISRLFEVFRRSVGESGEARAHRGRSTGGERLGVVNLADIEMSSEVNAIFAAYELAYGDSHRNFLREADYQRWSHILDRLKGGGRLLDVGIGVGQFVYAANLSPKFTKVVGVDKRAHSKLLVLNDDVELVWANAAALPFDDGEFESVTCMECLEHLDDATFESALSELRRVATREVMVTVPYDEPIPLTPGHLQQFHHDRIERDFPEGEVTLLRRRFSDVPWALIREEMN